MQMKCSKKVLSFILCMTLIVAMAFYTTGCNGKTDGKASVETEAALSSGSFSDGDTLGEGEKEFSLVIADKNQTETNLTIRTDKETVGEALLDLGVVEGEDSEYGLYVKTVNGMRADYDKDGVYWAFYINDEYAQAGVDATPIKEGETYSFKMEEQ